MPVPARVHPDDARRLAGRAEGPEAAEPEPQTELEEALRVVGRDLVGDPGEARELGGRAGVAIDFRHGDATHMPFPAGSFDLLVCRAAFKNFADPVGALDEMHRVLRPAGRASIFDLRKDAPLDAIDQEVREMQLSPLNAFLTRWTFRLMLLRSAYTREALEEMVARSRFGRGEIHQDGIGFELRLAK
jgi:ubiquinone/menaquinone biosynthesis C-methylase UbiE